MPGLMIDPRNIRGARILPRMAQQFYYPPVANATQQLPPPMNMAPSGNGVVPNANIQGNYAPPPPLPFQSGQDLYGSMGQQQQQQPLPDQVASTAPADTQVSTAQTPTDTTNQWSSTGKTDDFGTFFNKRSASDALTAFGAAMLKAPSFNQGLGDAALAVNQVDRENRMPTPQDIARAKLKGMVASMMYGFRQRGYTPGVTGYANGQFWQSIMNKTTGQTEWRGPGGAVQDQPPDGLIEGKYSGMAKNSNNNVQDAQVLYDNANTAELRIPSLDRQLDLLAHGTAGVNSDVATKLYREFASALNMPVGTVVPKDASEFARLAAQAELEQAQTQKGLGQLTEAEREIIRSAMASAGTNPDAAKEVLMMARQRANRIVQMQDAWSSEVQNGRSPNTYRDWAWQWMRQYDKDHPLTWSGSASTQHTTDQKAPDTNNTPNAGKTSSGVSWKVE